MSCFQKLLRCSYLVTAFFMEEQTRTVLFTCLIFFSPSISASTSTDKPGFLCIYVPWLIEYSPN